jgi:peptidoglycan/LPS O-acetylase OafA/YrhL
LDAETLSIGGNEGVNSPEHRNSYAALRWLFALSVVYTHSFDLLGFAGRGDWIAKVSGYKLSHLGVVGFFVLSGYLNTVSMERASGAFGGTAFLVRRAFRILPLLWGILITAVIWFWLKSGITGANIGAGVRFFMGNAFFYQPHYFLAGIFENNVNRSICGSLWTLQYEVLCYLILVVSGLGSLRGGAWLPRGILMTLLSAMLIVNTQDSPPFMGSIQAFWLGHLGWAFLCGIGLWKFPRILQSRKAVLASGLLLCISVSLREAVPPGWQMLQTAAYAVLVMKAGSYSWGMLARCADRWDASYGIYLFSFPVQQALIAGGWSKPYSLFLAAALLAAILGLLSWRFLEEPMLNLGKRLSARLMLRPEGMQHAG